jgi:hypothetical protein
MSRRLIVALVVAAIGVSACGRSSAQTEDLAASLVTATHVVVAGNQAIRFLGNDTMSTGIDLVTGPDDGRQLLVYAFERDRVELVTPFALADLTGTVRFWREPAFDADLERMMRDAEAIVLFLQPERFASDAGVLLSARAVTLDDQGRIVGSDWSGAARAQLQRVVSALAGRNVGLGDGLAAFLGAAFDEELDREIRNPLGAELLDAARGE